MVPVWAKAGAWTEADMVLGGTSRGLGGVFKSIQKDGDRCWRQSEYRIINFRV